MIVAEDSKALSKVSGIGAKTAQRIILELKDSMSKLMITDGSLLQENLNVDLSHKNEAIEALAALGYSLADAKNAVGAIFDERDTSEQIIKKALSLLGL